jgi:photosystem II stability/assembly factor-like uncharacterized protein
MPGILIGTDDGLLEVTPGEAPVRFLDGMRITSIDYRDGVAAAAVPGHGVWVSLTDAGHQFSRWSGDGWVQVWEGDAHSVRTSPGGEIYIGASPPALFAVFPGAVEANELGAFRGALRAESGHPPPSGDAGATAPGTGTEVVAIGFPDSGPEGILYVAVAGGAVWCAPNPGTTLQFERFEKRSDGLGSDLRGLWVHPERPDRVFTSTASGFFRSDDAGRTWVQSISGLDRSRASSLVVMPGSPDALVLACARRAPDLDGALFRSANGGVSWTRLMLENEDEWERAPLVARLWDSEDTLFAVAGDKIWGSHDGGRSWVELADGIPAANAMAPAL